MARTLIDGDDERLAAATVVLGTTTKVATVNQALADIAGRPRRMAYLDMLDETATDLGDPDVMDGAWR